ncbi:MAG: DUF2171 domain-containing protein, partial [Gemmataceae bacterium]
ADEMRGLVTEAGLANVRAARDEAQRANGGVTGPGLSPGHVGQPGPERAAGLDGVRERMDVIGSCGKKVGVVDHVECGSIKLTRRDSPDGQHHFIPADWVDHTDAQVHLNRNSEEAARGWKPDAASCSAC